MLVFSARILDLFFETISIAQNTFPLDILW